MKIGVLSKWRGVLGLAVLPLAGGWVSAATAVNNATEITQHGTEAAGATDSPAESRRSQVGMETPRAVGPDIAEAPAKIISTAKPVPANIRATGPTSEIIRLANSGVEESVLLAYVNNSTSTFNLDADAIIYLNDLGVPGKVVTS